MKDKFYRVTFDGDEKITPRLYRRHYTAAGKTRTKFYGVLTDWQGTRRKVPLGSALKAAIKKIYDLDKKNDNEVDFSEQRKKREARGVTLAKFIAAYSVSLKSPWHKAPLLAFFDKPIAQICNDDVIAYREKRAGEHIVKHGQPSAKLISPTSINKEISTLRKLLREARDKGYSHKVTKFEMASEPSRNRVLSPAEYAALLDQCEPWLKRAVMLAWETGLSRKDLFDLHWNQINLDEQVIELSRAKTGKPQIIPIYTPEMKSLLVELQEERRACPNIDGLVLTENGQPLDKLRFEYHFRRACRRAGITGFVLHDIRHNVATRLARNNIPTAVAMTFLGHSSVASHQKYQNLSRADVKAAFGIVHSLFTQKKQKRKLARK